MPYTYPIDAQAMFDDRTHQFVGLGLPADDVARVRAATTDFWADAPGGWVYEFSLLAAEYAAAGNHLLASLAYGCAKFPCLADEARRTALTRQLQQYELAAPAFPVRFERRTVNLTVGPATVELAVHLYTAAQTLAAAPVLLLGGGVDTWKMDFHQWCVLFARQAGVTVLAFDMPGTGENPVPLGPDADALVQGLAVVARGIGNGLVAHLGISFGGNFSALTGLTGTVDAAVVLGGPVDGAFEPANLRRLPYGMADIVGNAMGFDHPVTVDELSKAGAPLNRAALLTTAQNSPMLVVNGADDYFVPQQDTLVFQARPGVTVELIPGTGHCAMSKASLVLPRMIGWLRNHLGIPTAPSGPAAVSATDPTTAPVLVVGAGPVGLVMACELARREVPVRVIDTLPAPTVESRAILIHSRSLELLDRIGVVHKIIASGVRTEGMQMHADGRLLADLTVDGVDSPYPFSITTAQTETERILTERLTELGGSIERGVELLSFDQDDTAVTYRLRHADGTEETGTTGWIVGTDGSHSTVRAQTGQKLVGSFKGERFLLGDVDVDVDALPRDRMHSFFGTGGGPLLLFPMLGRRMRVIAQITDGNDDATVPRLQQVLDDRRVAARVGAARWLTVFEIHHAQVPQYRVGRAFLAGDAAHVHSPAGGQGMNTGMQDAFNLGWKLAAVVDGADENLLDSYQTERHPVAARVIEQTTRITNLGTVDNRLARTLRNTAVHLATRLPAVRRTVAEQLAETDLNYRSSPLVGGHGGSGGPRPGDCAPAVAGTRLWPLLADGTDPAGGATGTVALLFGSAGPDRDAGHAENADGASVLAGLRRIRVTAGPATGPVAQPDVRAAGGQDVEDVALDDPDGRIARRYGARPGDVVLVRPDGYIGFVGPLVDSAAIARYRSATGCGRPAGSAAAGTTSASVNDAPSAVAVATSAGVS